MSQLTARDLHLAYGPAAQRQPVLQNLDLSLGPDEILVLLGPSGCGKTSLLHVLAGLQAPDAGEIRIDGQATTTSDGRRGVVFQEHALLPWLNAADNLTLGLRLRGLGRHQRRQAAEDWLARIGMADLGRRRIDALSGGQRQRLGLARALATEPDFLLLDEPFAALDAITRERMQVLLLDLARRSHQGLLLITHSVEEALFLASELWLLEGPPLQVQRRMSLDFSQRHVAGEPVRDVVTDPRFQALSQELLQAMPAPSGRSSGRAA